VAVVVRVTLESVVCRVLEAQAVVVQERITLSPEMLVLQIQVVVAVRYQVGRGLKQDLLVVQER
tara:strand:+ start:597 stop:788 length:192 start_codon:yes stop_codon:yes gene_type:complete